MANIPSPGADSLDEDSANESPAVSPSPSAESPPLFKNPSVPAPPAAPTTAGISATSTPLGAVNAARRPAPPQPTMSSRGGSAGGLPQDLQKRLEAFRMGRQGAPQNPSLRSGGSQAGTPGPSPMAGQQPGGTAGSPQMGPGGVPAGFRMPPAVSRPIPHGSNSSPAIPGQAGPKLSLAQKRGMAFQGGLPTQSPAPPSGPKKRPGLSLSQMNAGEDNTKSDAPARDQGGSLMDKYSDFIDKGTGALKFKGKAVLTSSGVEFASGKSFDISLDEVDTMDELGKGNYGTVYKVRHSRPRIRKPGQGLAGNKSSVSHQSNPASGSEPSIEETVSPVSSGTTGVIMAMKEIRLELDDAKFAAIIMELDILHRCISPMIVDFYGAFFQEGAVYICMEFMDGGSIDKLYGDGIPEPVLRKIALATTLGLRALKDDYNIIHRDVKPTNILVNTKGQIKICDFGVSGNLVASIAKTNIGCQSYMAPERISSGGVAQAGANPGGGTYSVQSDIWSLGLTIIECALGQYPYPPETYDNIFSQLSAIVDGDPPDLPADKFSDAAHDFVSGCLMKIPKLRPTYAMLCQHAWLAPLLKPATISEEDEEAAEAGAALPSSSETFDTNGDKEVADWYRLNWTVDPKSGTYQSSHPTPTGIPSDPQLASYGVQQAEQLAGRIATLEPRPDVVYSSPFYRCLETLRPAVRALGLGLGGEGGKGGVRVENGISEFYGTARFTHPSPLPTPLLHLNHFPFIDTTHAPTIVPSTGGETLVGLHDRHAYALHRIVSACDADPARPTAALLCTHAAGMICIGRALTGRMPEDVREEDFRCGTCCLSVFRRRRRPSQRAQRAQQQQEQQQGEGEGKGFMGREEVAEWNPNAPEDVPDVDWRDGKGVGGGWVCEVNGDCTHLTGGEERTW
ncbi:MAG: hypothetical protein M1828_001270 [Chrysothrix sp. TS-e1954]|nr:MAG: hypothetical protein M1828_001270 [Chrysothrix sp. TS-e1954]